MLDDLFWPVTPADMPLLRELAYTFLQVKMWGDWSTGKPQSMKKLFEYIASPALRTFFATSQTADRYMAEVAAQNSTYVPVLLDMAHMGSMLGGSFLPGIEVGREAGVMENWSMYNGASQFFPDLRFFPGNQPAAHKPGMLTKDLAIPWQVDFTACEDHYWPTSRPGEVSYQRPPAAPLQIRDWMLGGTDGDLVRGRFNSAETSLEHEIRYINSYWHMLGFVRRDASNRFVEQELHSSVTPTPKP